MGYPLLWGINEYPVSAMGLALIEVVYVWLIGLKFVLCGTWYMVHGTWYMEVLNLRIRHFSKVSF